MMITFMFPWNSYCADECVLETGVLICMDMDEVLRFSLSYIYMPLKPHP